MEVVQTINKEIASVVTNTAADMTNSKNGFSPTSPKQSKFSSAPKDLHISNVSNSTMFFTPVLATRQAHHMQQDILPESTTLNMSTPIHFQGAVLFGWECPVLWRTSFFRLQGFCNPSPFLQRPHSDSLVSSHSQISYGACPSYWNSTSSLTITSFFVYLPMQPMHCFSELMKHIAIGNISGRS